jgi:hypothetical protein
MTNLLVVRYFQFLSWRFAPSSTDVFHDEAEFLNNPYADYGTITKTFAGLAFGCPASLEHVHKRIHGDLR